jgi:diketogulonate reductase-like aldo/keto reductase
MEMKIMTLTAYNDRTLPSFMYGTAWKKETTTGLVVQAVETGFTAIDTANQLIHYEEARVGEALQHLSKNGTTRDKLFLQTKFTPVNGQDHRTPYDAKAGITTQVQQSFASSLSHLHTDYLDSYVMHGPYARHGLGPEDWEVWAAIEALYEAGSTNMIGISNVSAEQLALLCDRAKHKPMVVQNRCYAAFGWDREVRALCRAHKIVYQGFSLLTANRPIFADPEIRAIAHRHGMTLAQVVFRFSMQIGMVPLTGTISRQHMDEDLQSVRFTLSPEELERIETIGL